MPHQHAHPRYWTTEASTRLAEIYASHSAQECAAILGVSVSRVRNKAHEMGLRKSADWRRERARAATLDPSHPSRQHLFKPGHATWNKGRPGSTGKHPRTAAHHFKPGQLHGAAQANSLPLGTYSINGDGLLRIKVCLTPGPQQLRWRLVHRLVWEQAHGSVPPGHIIVFRPGMRTAVLADITLDRLECISRAENVHRNSVHRHGPELQRLAQLRGCITRQINQRLRAQQPGADAAPSTSTPPTP